MRNAIIIFLERTCRAVAPLIPKRFLFIFKEYSPVVPMNYRHRVLMHLDSHAEYARAHSSKKEPATVAWIEEHFAPGDVMYDVGANVGPFSLIAAAFLKKEVRIVAIEPHPPTYAKLCANILLNSYGACITPISVALAAQTSVQPFNYRAFEEGSSGHALGAAADQTGEYFVPVGMHMVAAYKLDDLVKTFSLQSPVHIKIDVDGIESDILEGATEVLLSASLRTVMVEMEKSEDHKNKVIESMKKYGFTLRSVGEGRNHLFVREV